MRISDWSSDVCSSDLDTSIHSAISFNRFQMSKYASSLRFIGASLLALAIATPALAQDKATEGPGVLDELVPEGSPYAAVPPAPTGDPVLDRLNALEFKVRALETRNVELETALDTANGRVETVTSKEIGRAHV